MKIKIPDAEIPIQVGTMQLPLLPQSHIFSGGFIGVLNEAANLRECSQVEDFDINHQTVFSTFLRVFLQCK